MGTRRCSIDQLVDKWAADGKGELGRRKRKLLNELSGAVWSGRFDDVLGLKREVLSRLFPRRESWVPDVIRNSPEGEPSPEVLDALAALPLSDCNEWWQRSFGQLTIPERRFYSWVRTLRQGQQEKNERFKRIENAAIKLKQRYPEASNSEIARRLTARGGRFEGYGAVTVRKIIGGTYRPAQQDGGKRPFAG